MGLNICFTQYGDDTPFSFEDVLTHTATHKISFRNLRRVRDMGHHPILLQGIEWSIEIEFYILKRSLNFLALFCFKFRTQNLRDEQESSIARITQ